MVNSKKLKWLKAGRAPPAFMLSLNGSGLISDMTSGLHNFSYKFKYLFGRRRVKHALMDSFQIPHNFFMGYLRTYRHPLQRKLPKCSGAHPLARRGFIGAREKPDLTESGGKDPDTPEAEWIVEASGEHKFVRRCRRGSSDAERARTCPAACRCGYTRSSLERGFD